MTNTLNIIPNGIIDLRCKHFIPKRLISNQNIWIFTDKWFVKLKITIWSGMKQWRIVRKNFTVLIL